MGRAARPLHDPEDHRPMERGSFLLAACRGSLNRLAKTHWRARNTTPLLHHARGHDLSRTCLGVHLDVGRCGRPRRRPLLIALATRVINAKIVLGMLVEILGRYSIAARRRFARQDEVPLEYLVGAATDLDVGSVAVECLIAL